jgi:putative tryptophan/tyrosine transport system substrate-binding protein
VFVGACSNASPDDYKFADKSLESGDATPGVHRGARERSRVAIGGARPANGVTGRRLHQRAVAPRCRALRRRVRAGLGEAGITDGQNVRIEYHWLDGQYDHLPLLMSDFVRRPVAVIATPGTTPAALAAKAATADIPIVFGSVQNPVSLGLVASLARPGGNATGFNMLNQETVAKQLELLHQLVPKAVRVAVLVNPANISNTEFTSRALPDAARALGLEIVLLKASSTREIEEAFAAIVRERADALFVAPDGFLSSRRVQFAILAARHGIPSAGIDREAVEAGALMNYATDPAEMYRQVGVYTGRILKGAKPADLPVIQSTKFEFVINITTANALGVSVPPNLLAIADQVFE